MEKLNNQHHLQLLQLEKKSMEVQNYHSKMYVFRLVIKKRNDLFLYLNSSFLLYKKSLFNQILVQCMIILLKLVKDQQQMFI
jgi:hypothetical protein